MTPRRPKPDTAQPQGERLQKILAGAGVASRRAAEELIASGRVSVNGQVVTQMGQRAIPGTDKIEVDGKPIASATPGAQADFVYIALNKPPGVVTTAKDTHGRATVLDLIRNANLQARGVRVFPVGRLDADTTGLLLLTNDGDLTFRLTHPRYGIEKEYRAVVRGQVALPALRKLREGIEIEGEKTAPALVTEIGKQGTDTVLKIVIHEGRKRQVRLMCSAVGHPVLDLQRVRYGPLELGDLPVGRWRNLAAHEVHALKKAVKQKPVTPARPTKAQAKTSPRATRGEERTNEQRPARRPPTKAGDRAPAGGQRRQGRSPSGPSGPRKRPAQHDRH